MKSVIAMANGCEYTSLETVKSELVMGDLTITQYKDNNGRNRFVVSNNETSIAGLLFDCDNVCEFRYTNETYRQQGYQRQLWAYCASVLGYIEHSEDLTDLGQLAAAKTL